MPMSVVMTSAAINCSEDTLLNIHVIEDGYDNKLKQRVTDSLNKVRAQNLKIYWYPVNTESISDLPVVQSHINLMTYSRLLLPQLLPPTVKQALYLDCDILVEGDIAELWIGYESKKALGAVRDRIEKVSSKGGLSNYQDLNITAETPYFNAGVLMFNVEKWRSESISQRVFEYLRKYSHLLQFNDQEALNAVLHDDWSEMPSKWNQQIVPRYFRNGSPVALPNQIQGGIIHFITGEKPWIAGCEYVERQLFFEYLDRTDWRGWKVKRREELYVRGKRALGNVWQSVKGKR